MKRIKWIVCVLMALALLLAGVGCGNGGNLFDFDPSDIKTEEDYENMLKDLTEQPEPADVDEYSVHEDGGLIYNPISRSLSDGQKRGFGETRKGELKLGGNTLKYEIPSGVNAYEAIPIRYELTFASGQEMPVHVEATAFEEADASEGKWFDLALPGKTDLEWEYLGYVAGFETGERHVLAADYSDEPASAYPGYETTELRRSGVVEAADYHWFRFRYTNVGDTILDPEGAGGMQFEPVLYERKENGNFTKVGVPYNKYYRITEYIYPGESREMWIAFGPHVDTPNMGWGLEEGDYQIQLKAVYRSDRSNPEDYATTQYGGYEMSNSTFDFSVRAAAQQTEPNAVQKGRFQSGIHNTWLHTFEEFMTSYETWTKNSGTVSGTLYLQVAPFTEQVVLKLITTDPLGLASIALPVEVSTDHLSLELNTSNPYWTVREDGTRFPVIVSQSQADMRGNIQLSPYPEEQIVQDLMDMQSCGVNMVSTTAMPWLYDINGTYRTVQSDKVINPQGDAYKFMLDALRELGIEVEAIGNYPFGRTTVGNVARWAGGAQYTIANAYPGWGCEASPSDPNLADAVFIQSDYQFKRWGDNYFTAGNGFSPLTFEDTRGWMRIDMNTRFPIGEAGKEAFQKWAIDFYGSMTKLNEAWGTEYAYLTEIDPEEGQVAESNGQLFAYNNPANPFHNWSAPVTALDVWRTVERVNNYRDVMEKYSSEVPNAKVGIRTEGANWLVAGIPSDTANSHYRHIYYSQRMNGMIAEIVQVSGLVLSHADYQTLPYTPDEVRELTRASVAQGIIPMHIPQFCNMRDIAVNRFYGNNFTDVYNLKTSRRGAFIHTLSALYPWFAATYEEGGVPGILWQDYECDGYATETQKKEMKFFLEKLEETLATPEGVRWKTEFTAKDEQYKTNSLKLNSYDPEYVRKVIQRMQNSL